VTTTVVTSSPPPPPITAADILAAAWRHRLTLARGVTLDPYHRRCCGIGALAVLLNPSMAHDGDGLQARRLVCNHIGRSAADGLEEGFEGTAYAETVEGDISEFDYWRAVGVALAREVSVVPKETVQP
jgi:hypothetical protein